jgi:hypothetical protein
MIHSKVSGCELEITSSESFDNLRSTIEFYFHRLSETNYKYHISQQFEAKIYNTDQDSFVKDMLEVEYDYINNKPLTNDEVMLIDFEKGIRKDLKLQLKKKTANK